MWTEGVIGIPKDVVEEPTFVHYWVKHYKEPSKYGEADAYNKLIAALVKAAREQKRISPTEKPQENLKYAMRLFLVRLGFVGDEYKQARKILLRELSGNCSWKSGHAPERTTPDEMEVETNEE